MRTLNRIAQIAYIFCIGLILLVLERPAHARPSPIPTGTKLTETVTKLDANLFSAYNDCNLKSFGRYIAPDIQFYHDKTGLTVGRSQLVAAIKDNICGKLHRKLIPGTLAVYPIPGYGALETGADQFCELHTGNCDFFSKFAQLWQYRHGTWLLTIVFSYDHHTGSLSGVQASPPDHSVGRVSTAQVPFVSCPGIGGADPGPWPTPRRAPKSLPSSPTIPATRLAYYRAVRGPGVFAPRGWHCRTWGGSNGAFIIVTPSVPPAVIPREAVKGLGVIGIESYGGTSGRFEVAEVSARLFPDVEADFIARVKAEGFPSPDFSKIHPLSDDQYTYLTPKLVKFTTPARHEGIGTGIFVPSTEPVRGVISLSSGDGRYPDLLQFEIRLAASENRLTRALIDLELQCLKASWPSC